MAVDHKYKKGKNKTMSPQKIRKAEIKLVRGLLDLVV